jgi:hypothetical protein
MNAMWHVCVKTRRTLSNPITKLRTPNIFPKDSVQIRDIRLDPAGYLNGTTYPGCSIGQGNECTQLFPRRLRRTLRPCVTFRNKLYFMVRIVLNPSPNPQAGGPSLIGWPWLFIQYIRSYPPLLEAVVNTVMNLRVPQEMGNILTSWVTISFSRQTVLHGVG